MSSKDQLSNTGALTCEPRLSEVLNDPVVHAVMARDGVTREDLCSIIRNARQSLRARNRR